MNKYLLYITIIFASGLSLKTHAQNDVQISHYMFNRINFNPAFCGDDEYIRASLLVRQQWLGYYKHPQTEMLNGDMYVQKIKGGVGASIMTDRLGFESTFNFRAMYAYHYNLNESAKISAGIAIGIMSRALKGNELMYEDRQTLDPNGLYAMKAEMRPTFDVGAKFKFKEFNGGFSFTHLNQSNPSSTFYNVPRHMYLYASYPIPVMPKLEITPTILYKQSPHISILDINGIAKYQERYYAGFSLRPKDALVFIVGMQVTEQLKAFYAFDMATNPIKSYSIGSHEICVTFAMLRPPKLYKSPRFF